MKKLTLCLAFYAAGLSLSAVAQTDPTVVILDTTVVTDDSTMVLDRIISDLPLQSSRPAITPKGNFQMEHQFIVEDTEPGFIYSYPASLWKYGVTNNFEVRLRTEYRTIQKEPNPDVNGFLPLAVGIKAKLGEQKGVLPKISVVGDLTLPGLVAEDFETIYLAPDIRLAFEHHVSKLLGIGYNVGLEWDGINAEPNVNYSLYLDLALTDRLGLFMEGYGTTPQREDDDMEARVDAGLSYLFGNDFLIHVSGGTGLTEEAVEGFVSAGFSYRFRL